MTKRKTRERLFLFILVLMAVLLCVWAFKSCNLPPPPPPPPPVTTVAPPTFTATYTPLPPTATLKPTKTPYPPTATPKPTLTRRPTATNVPPTEVNWGVRWWNCYTQTWMDYPRASWHPCVHNVDDQPK